MKCRRSRIHSCRLFLFVVWCVPEVEFIGVRRVLSLTTTNRRLQYHASKVLHQEAPTVQPVDTFTDSSQINDNPLNTRAMRSLAGPYLIQSIEDHSVRNENGTCTVMWSLIPLDAIPSDVNATTGSSMCQSAMAWSTLQSTDNTNVEAEPTSCITATLAPSANDLEVRYTSKVPPDLSADRTLIAVLSRVLVQCCLWSWYRQQQTQFADSIPTTAWTPASTMLRLPNEAPRTVSFSFFAKKELQLGDDDYASFVRSLFQQMSVDTSDSELVEMVHGDSGDAGRTVWLGVVPRHWVHQCNLLHRGIGVFITKDRPIRFPCPVAWKPPDLYCHQRTATKRIFPLLYDMFVGGISLVGEDPKETARREIAEELGLQAAFEKDDGKLSDRLIRCVVCTSYNRCVVDVFGYAVDTTTERIKWQEEEVAWGAFVPYDIVSVAAEQSIRRLMEANKWPGRYLLAISSSPTVDTNALELAGDIDRQWKQWDFVPDGLLVWEAWIHAQKE